MGCECHEMASSYPVSEPLAGANCPDEEEDGTPQLSAYALAALQEFYAEKLQEFYAEKLQESSLDKPSAVPEDWVGKVIYQACLWVVDRTSMGLAGMAGRGKLVILKANFMIFYDYYDLW